MADASTPDSASLSQAVSDGDDVPMPQVHIPDDHIKFAVATFLMTQDPTDIETVVGNFRREVEREIKEWTLADPSTTQGPVQRSLQERGRREYEKALRRLNSTIPPPKFDELPTPSESTEDSVHAMHHTASKDADRDDISPLKRASLKRRGRLPGPEEADLPDTSIEDATDVDGEQRAPPTQLPADIE